MCMFPRSREEGGGTAVHIGRPWTRHLKAVRQWEDRGGEREREFLLASPLFSDILPVYALYTPAHTQTHHIPKKVAGGQHSTESNTREDMGTHDSMHVSSVTPVIFSPWGKGNNNNTAESQKRKETQRHSCSQRERARMPTEWQQFRHSPCCGCCCTAIENDGEKTWGVSVIINHQFMHEMTRGVNFSFFFLNDSFLTAGTIITPPTTKRPAQPDL